MKLSIITATWNLVTAGRGEMLRRCVRSVSAVRDAEYTIIDGGSTDGTVEEIKNEELRIKNAGGACGLRWISERDRGIYDALNKGVRMAQGEWIHILGCDDYICDSVALENAIAEGERNGAEIIITPVEKDGGGRSINLKACLYSIPYCHQGVLMKKSLIERLGGFNAALRLAGDYELTLKAHLSGAKEVVLPYRFAHYSTGGASSNWAKLHEEVNAVAACQFGLTAKETDRFDKTRCLPIRVVFPLLFHRRGMVRRGAAWQLIRNVVCLVKRKCCERI